MGTRDENRRFVDPGQARSCAPVGIRNWPRRALVSALLLAGFHGSAHAHVQASTELLAYTPWVLLPLLLSAVYARARASERERVQSVAAGDATLQEQPGTHGTLLGNLPGMAYRCENDADWTMRSVSRGCEELTGYTADELTQGGSVSYADLIHPDDRAAVWIDVQRAIAGQRFFQFVYRLRTRTGEEKYVLDQGRAITDITGKVMALEGFVTDITPLYRAERENMRGDANFRLLLQSMGEGVYGVDAQGRCTFINPAGASMLGYGPEELLGRTLHDVIHAVDPCAPGHCPACDYDASTHKAFVRDCRFLQRDGGIVTVQCNVAPIVENGVVCGHVVCFANVTERRRTSARLRQLLHAVEQSPTAVVLTDLQGNVEFVNASFTRLTGYSAAEMVGNNRSLLRSEDTTAQTHRQLWSALESRGEWRGDLRNRRKNGTLYWSHQAISVIRDESNQPVGYLVIEEDITQAQAAEQALMKSQQRLAEAQRIASMGNWEFNLSNGDLWWSDEVFRIYGYAPQQIRPTYEFFLKHVHPDDLAGVMAAVDAAWYARQSYSIEFRIIRADGAERIMHSYGEVNFDEKGVPMLMQGTAHDITERKRTEQQLHHLAYYDGLTGLPNRTLFLDRLQQATLEAKRHGRTVALIFLDLDRFKHVNETMGHDSGDALLRAAAQRVRWCVREEDTVARLGGDDFAVLLSDLREAQGAATTARKILEALRQPFVVGGQDLIVTGSIGISVYPSDGDDAQTLLKNADAAMDYAKEQGRNNYQFYSSHMTAAAFERLVLENSLRRALEREEFELHYQPQLDVASGAVIGCEALLRWRHPELGMVSPLRFIPLAEETGLIVPIGEWVLRAACREAMRWTAAGLPPLRVAVNLSCRQFREAGLAQLIEGVLTETGLTPERLELELTESVIMEYTETAVQMLGELWALGVQLALDDFGTGYSSLSYLKRLPMHVLKIDRSFIKDLTTDASDASLTRAIIHMAHSMGIQVVAEGVETREQLDFLRAEGCDFIQGYYFSQPLPAGEFEALIRGGKTLQAIGE